MLKIQEYYLDELELKIQNAIMEEEKNFKRLFQACDNLKLSYPFTVNKLEDDIIVEHLDQLSFRFIKIQDSIGRRLIPYVVEYLFGNNDGLTFLDMLNKLEKLNIVTKIQWNIFRNLRNDLTHIYPDDDKIVDTLNLIYTKKDELYKIYDNLKERVINEFQRKIRKYFKTK